MSRLRSITFTGLALLGAGNLASCQPATDSVGGEKVKSDLTLYLRPPLLGGGGTVIIIPRAVSAEDFKTGSGQSNPASNDPFLEANKPLQEGDLRLGAVLSDPVTIVQFDYPQSGSFNFRFAPERGSEFPPGRLVTKHIGTGGEGEELHPTTKDVVKVGSSMHIHVGGDSVTEEDSRIVESKINIGALRERYQCRDFDRVLVCDVSGDVGK
jgi:hypothetical protein